MKAENLVPDVLGNLELTFRPPEYEDTKVYHKEIANSVARKFQTASCVYYAPTDKAYIFIGNSPRKAILPTDPLFWREVEVGDYRSVPILSAIEILQPQGEGAAVYSINSGNPATTGIVVSPPTIKLRYAYSPNQQVYGIQSEEIDNPLLRTEEELINAGNYRLNYATWSRNKVTTETASIPTIEPGRIIQFYQPRLGPKGSDVWMYIQSISRSYKRGSGKEGGEDKDSYSGFLMYTRARS